MSKPLTVYTTGVYDIIHAGHLGTLKYAQSLGDRLIVGIQDDASVLAQKGKAPIMSNAERKAFLEELPFVDECIIYTDVDQRQLLTNLQPDMMVQTEEWVAQTDRSAIITHCAASNIRLVLRPINKTISSSHIKQRILEAAEFSRRDVSYVRSSIRAIRIADIQTYEDASSERVARVKKSIQETGSFSQPVTLGMVEDTPILIDGANRLQAMKELGATFIIAHCIPYAMDTDVRLRGNVHYLEMTHAAVHTLATQAGFSCPPFETEADALRALSEKQTHALIVDNGHIMGIGTSNDDRISTLNTLVDTYTSTTHVHRLSELGYDTEQRGLKIIFPTFSKEEIATLAQTGGRLASGITWHMPTHAAIHFEVPIDTLMGDDPSDWLAREIDRKLQDDEVRYYTSNVFDFSD